MSQFPTQIHPTLFLSASQMPPSSHSPPFPPPHFSVSQYPYPPVLSQGLPATTISSEPVLLSAVTPPDIDSVLAESQYNGQWYSGGRRRTSPPPQVPVLVVTRSVVSIPTEASFSSWAAYLPDSGPPCGVTRPFTPNPGGHYPCL